jgi:hypothetical protein
MKYPTISLDSGAARRWTLTIGADGTGLPATGFTGADALAAQVWPGDDRPALFAPALAWLDATAATCRLTISAAQSATLAAGQYAVRATVTPGDGLTRAIWRATLVICATPGTRVAPATYGTSDGLLQLAPWLADLASASDQSSFAEPLGRARAWLDKLILRRWVGLGGDGSGWAGAGGDGTGSAWFGSGAIGPSAYQRAQVAAGCVVVNAELLEIVYHQAAAYALEHAIGDRGGTSYQKLGDRYAARADDLALGCTVELDLSGTLPGAVASIGIPLGSSTMR